MRFSTSCKKVKVNLSCLENSLETLIFMQISDFNQFLSCVVPFFSQIEKEDECLHESES